MKCGGVMLCTAWCTDL